MMITINADSLLAGRELVRKKGIEAKTKALLQYRSHILAMFRELLLISPQYSSDLVSNWDIETERRAARGYSRHPEKQEYERGMTAPHEAGDLSDGFNSAYARGLNRMKDITYYGQPVYFVNPSFLDIDSPLVIGPDGVQELRDANVIFAWASISSYLQERFGAPR